MQALILDSRKHGQFCLAEVESPAPKAGQVRLRVHASGVNPIDVKIRQGHAPYAAAELPAVLGTDVSGIVTEVGPGVEDFAIGDRVYGMAGGVRGLQGSLAEFMTVDAGLVVKKPGGITMREAAALPLVALTAWEGLVHRAHVQPGQKVLIQGGAGGVGHIAVQLAKVLGADVYATASTGKQDLLRKLGATPIDYTKSEVEQYVAEHTGGKGFDVVYDTVGGATYDASLRAVRQYGHMVSCAAAGEHNMTNALLRCVNLSNVFVLYPLLSGEGRERHNGSLREISALVESGKIRPILDPRHFTLDNAMDAHDALERGANVKIVVNVTEQI